MIPTTTDLSRREGREIGGGAEGARSRASFTYGGVPVPYAAAWSAEARTYVGTCAHSGHRAVCQDVAPGVGKPTFGIPHSQRQREAIARDLCDVCGRPLRNRTKVSLSHARPQVNGAEGLAVLQVEPLLHRGCAALALKHCPSLKRDIANGTLRVRQVYRHRTQIAFLAPQYIGQYVPGYVAEPHERIAGHAKVELLSWRDRDATWLGTPDPLPPPTARAGGGS